MRLTLQTDYALRMLMHLAVQDGDRATISDVADSYRISKNHLMKVAQALVRAGAVEAVRAALVVCPYRRWATRDRR